MEEFVARVCGIRLHGDGVFRVGKGFVVFSTAWCSLTYSLAEDTMTERTMGVAPAAAASTAGDTMDPAMVEAAIRASATLESVPAKDTKPDFMPGQAVCQRLQRAAVAQAAHPVDASRVAQDGILDLSVNGPLELIWEVVEAALRRPPCVRRSTVFPYDVRVPVPDTDGMWYNPLDTVEVRKAWGLH